MASQRGIERPELSAEAIAGFNRQLGLYINALRRSRRWSRQDLADLAGVNRDTVLQLETDEHPNPTLDTLIQIALAFIRES